MDPAACCINASAQHFFNDILYGLYDKTLSGYNFKSHYEKYCDGLNSLDDMGEIQPLFTRAKILAELLKVKCNIGINITEAYRAGNKNKLKNLTDELKHLLKLYQDYHLLSMILWHKVYKPFGWEGCDMMLGGMEARINTALNRLEEYLDGKLESIPELEAERLYYSDVTYPLTESGLFRDIMSAGCV